jgi:hypothetical protein
MAVSMHLEARSGFRRSSSDFAVTSNSHHGVARYDTKDIKVHIVLGHY